MIASLQALRFIFALFIFAEHFPLSPEQPHLLAGAGAMGVSFFLVLSGFVMSIGYEQRVQQGAERWGKLPAIGRYTLEALPILLYGIALHLVREYNTGFTDVTLFYLPSCLVIFLFALSSKCEEKSGIPDLLNQDWLIYLGKISFSFYMIHNLVILFVKRIMEWISPLHPWELRLLFSLATTLVLSVTINRFFEAPLADILGRAVQRKHK